MRTILTWLGIGGAVLAAIIAKTAFNFTETQIGFAFLFIFVMVLNYQVDALKEQKPTFKKKRLKDLFYSKPIDVKHKQPKSLTPDGKERFGAEEYDFESFRWFWFFGEAANRDFQESCRSNRVTRGHNQ